MFVSAGTVLKLHHWNKHHLDTVAIYKPKKSFYQKITDVSWSYDNTYILFLQDQNQPQIISTRDRSNVTLIHTIHAVKNVTASSFENHTKRLLGLGTKEGNIVLYDTKNRTVANEIASLNFPINFLEFNPTDDQLAVGIDDKLIIYFDQDRNNEFTKEIEFLEHPTAVKFHPNIPSLMAIGQKNGEVLIKDNDTSEVVNKLQKHSSSVTGITFLGGEKTIITTGLDHKICMYDYNSQENVFRISMQQAITALDVSFNEPFIAVGTEDGHIFMYDIRQPWSPLANGLSQDGPVNKISFEKGPLCLTSDFEENSATTLNDTDYTDNQVINCMADIDKIDNHNEGLKKEMLKMVKSHVTSLENLLVEHCSKFQSFINNEFDAIHNAMARWDLFNIGEGSDVGQHDTDAGKSVKSTYIYRSTN